MSYQPLHDTEEQQEPTPNIKLPPLQEERPTVAERGTQVLHQTKERASEALAQTRDYLEAAYHKATTSSSSAYAPLMTGGKTRARTCGTRVRELARERWIYPLLIGTATLVLLSTVVFGSAWIQSSSNDSDSDSSSMIEVDLAVFHGSFVDLTPGEEQAPAKDLSYGESCLTTADSNMCALKHASNLMVATLVFATLAASASTFLLYFSHLLKPTNVIAFETLSQYGLAALLALTSVLEMSVFWSYVAFDLTSFFNQENVSLHYTASVYLSLVSSILYLLAAGLMMFKPVLTCAQEESGFDFGEQGYEVTSTPKMPHPQDALMMNRSNVL